MTPDEAAALAAMTAPESAVVAANEAVQHYIDRFGNDVPSDLIQLLSRLDAAVSELPDPGHDHPEMCPEHTQAGDLVTAEGGVVVYACPEGHDFSVPLPTTGRES